MNKIISISAIASFTLLISACSLSPNLNIPEANYSIDNKLGALSWEKENNSSITKNWWKDFDDENLNKVVDLALKNNNDLKLAFIHMEQAAAQLGIDFSSLLPKFDGSASGSRAKTAINAPSNRTGEVSYGNDFKMGLNLSYEIDLWGKYRDTYRASKSALKQVSMIMKLQDFLLFQIQFKLILILQMLMKMKMLLKKPMNRQKKFIGLMMKNFKLVL